MQICPHTCFADRKTGRADPIFEIGDDFLLVHAMLDISIDARQQEPLCSVPEISSDANDCGMDDLAADTKLINDLCEFARKKPSRIAADLGMAATTLTRPANGKATTRLGRGTLQALRAAYPLFPPFADQERPPANATPVRLEGASLERMSEDMPIYGSALGAAREIDGEAIEQTTLNRAEVLQYAKRPVMLNGFPDVYGLFVSGSSMSPRFKDGAMIVVNPKDRVRTGDDVVVYLRPAGDEDDGETARAVLVKEMVRRTSTYIELLQHSPAKIFRIDMREVVRVDRVVPYDELMLT